MHRIGKRFSFSASHFIGGLPAAHPCARLHGHNYEVEVALQAPALDTVGFVRDFRELSALKDFINASSSTPPAAPVKTPMKPETNDAKERPANRSGPISGVKRNSIIVVGALLAWLRGRERTDTTGTDGDPGRT